MCQTYSWECFRIIENYYSCGVLKIAIYDNKIVLRNDFVLLCSSKNIDLQIIEIIVCPINLCSSKFMCCLLYFMQHEEKDTKNAKKNKATQNFFWRCG